MAVIIVDIEFEVSGEYYLSLKSWWDGIFYEVSKTVNNTDRIPCHYSLDTKGLENNIKRLKAIIKVLKDTNCDVKVNTDPQMVNLDGYVEEMNGLLIQLKEVIHDRDNK